MFINIYNIHIYLYKVLVICFVFAVIAISHVARLLRLKINSHLLGNNLLTRNLFKWKLKMFFWSYMQYICISKQS